MREVTPTRSTALDLADELRLMRQGYEFLDEKRMLLATEMLRQMRQYQAQSEVFDVPNHSHNRDPLYLPITGPANAFAQRIFSRKILAHHRLVRYTYQRRVLSKVLGFKIASCLEWNTHRAKVVA